jgi:hypothetical protein
MEIYNHGFVLQNHCKLSTLRISAKVDVSAKLRLYTEGNYMSNVKCYFNFTNTAPNSLDFNWCA